MGDCFAYSEINVNSIAVGDFADVRYLRRAPRRQGRYIGAMKLRIREIRTQQGLTQRELGEKAGISISYLSEVESGKKPLNSRRIEKVARALGVSPTDLIDDSSVDPDILDHIRRLQRLSDADREAIIHHAEALDRGSESP